MILTGITLLQVYDTLDNYIFSYRFDSGIIWIWMDSVGGNSNSQGDVLSIHDPFRYIIVFRTY
jgi:hypothetical protein